MRSRTRPSENTKLIKRGPGGTRLLVSQVGFTNVFLLSNNKMNDIVRMLMRMINKISIVLGNDSHLGVQVPKA